MKVATRDRGEIMHFAGFHGLSPALRDGIPALVGGPDATATRCGWETFFRALDDRGLAMVYERDDPSSAEFRSVADVKDLRREHGTLAGAVEHARRFLRALFPRSDASAEHGEHPAA